MTKSRFKVRAHPRSRRNAISVDDDAARVWVTASPEGGKANEAVIELMSKRLGVPKRDIEIVSGARSRLKLVAVRGLCAEEALRRLAQERGNDA